MGRVLTGAGGLVTLGGQGGGQRGGGGVGCSAGAGARVRHASREA